MAHVLLEEGVVGHTQNATAVSVVIPYAGTCEHRQRALAWVRARLAAAHPSWEVLVGLGGVPWCKAAAVEDGLTRASGDVLVVHDADVSTDLRPAVDAVVEGAAWSMPHGDVHRLNEGATGQVLDGAPPELFIASRSGYVECPYPGWEGGGVVVLRRADYETAPLDHRFQNWGQEDASWALALSTIVGDLVRLDAPLFHLWHPAPPRLTRIVGSKESGRLWRRYQQAVRRPDRMAELVEEGRASG